MNRHRIGLLTILFTDIVGSVALKQTLGDATAVRLIQAHHGRVRELLAGFPDGEEIETAGDSFLLVFTKPSEAVRYALQLQASLREFAANEGQPIQDRIGIHVGEVFVAREASEAAKRRLFGTQVDTCARLMSL